MKRHYIELLPHDYGRPRYANDIDPVADLLTMRKEERRGAGVNPDLWDALESVAETVGTADDQLTDDETNTLSPKEAAGVILGVIDDFLAYVKSSGDYDSIAWAAGLSNSALVRLYDASVSYLDFSRNIFDRAKDLAEVASALMGRLFSSGKTVGAGQSDWLSYICPAEID